MVKNNLSCRYALKNHVKKTITAIRVATKKVGPTQGYFDVPHSSVLHSSALISPPLSAVYLLVTDAQQLQKGVTPLSDHTLPATKQSNT